MIHDFASAQSEFAKARSKHRGRPVANNTRLYEVTVFDESGERVTAYVIRLHGTDVVTYLPSGNVILNSGGWRTVTTADRINAFGPARVYTQQRYTETGARAKTSWGELDKAWAIFSAEPIGVTPPRVQKCRTCKGEGSETRVQTHYSNAETGWRQVALDEPITHVTPCYRCDGTGTKDYGSVKVYPDFFDGIIVGPTGKVVEPAKVAA